MVAFATPFLLERNRFIDNPVIGINQEISNKIGTKCPVNCPPIMVYKLVIKQ